MLSVDVVTAVPYSDPWNIDLPQRMRMLARGKTSVAYFYEKPDDSTFRYRIYNMTQVLNSTGNVVSASFFFLDDLHWLARDLPDALRPPREPPDQRVSAPRKTGALRCR